MLKGLEPGTEKRGKSSNPSGKLAAFGRKKEKTDVHLRMKAPLPPLKSPKGTSLRWSAAARGKHRRSRMQLKRKVREGCVPGSSAFAVNKRGREDQRD